MATDVDVELELGHTVEKYSPRRCQTKVLGVDRSVRVSRMPLSCRFCGGRAHVAVFGLGTPSTVFASFAAS